ncbi:MAG: glycine hydroxymethyltransferase [Candidatus Methanomethylophilaceae archaeon]|nr:glycine hydroxymethyltransferase [Candidatus Methanomethylophilaceae archaeon]MDI3542026.1 glycine hydroxymethyltransferase [Candidatus Methanomethylophilaceae archaeon]HIJ00981.1 serine hydroxymethyltransferase [Candidatus Methanomethylophilaceae archaeon]
MNEEAFWIRERVKAHNKWFEESLPMIASENLMSPLAKEMLISDFADRYAEGLPGKRYYQGNIYVDEVELKAIEMAKDLFQCSFADVRPISGTVANMAVLFAFAEPGDTITTCALAQGAHISTAKFGAFGLRSVESVNYPFNETDMNLDVDGTIKLLKEVRPKVAQFGLSVFLFPPPLKELEDTFHEIGCTVWYDAAHVFGLIAGGQFDDPLHKGVHVVSSSTHKTFPGPNHGMLLGNNLDEEQEKALYRAVFPGVTSSHHLHAMASLAITLAEEKVFGKEYALQTVRNARALGEALYERGINVLCPDLGFTRSHTLAVDVSAYGGGKIVAQDLENANIICNKNMLPKDTSAVRPSGIRLGVQELTRTGMKESEMVEVAELITRVCNKESPAKVKEDVKELKKGFTKIRYCFHEGEEAYRYHELV